VAIEGDHIALRMRLFKHDLEDALKAYHSLPRVMLTPTVPSDSLFLSYLHRYFSLVVEGDTLPGQVVSSGEDRDIWWYDLSFNNDSSIDSVRINNQLLFDLFGDQKNIVYVTHFPSEQRETLYCVAGSAGYTVVF
jgi:hypothetical protein